jgi:hypothetical protein
MHARPRKVLLSQQAAPVHGWVLGHEHDQQADQVDRERRQVIVGKVRADQKPVGAARPRQTVRRGAAAAVVVVVGRVRVRARLQQNGYGGEHLARGRKLHAAVNLLPEGAVAVLALAVVVERRAARQVEQHQRGLFGWWRATTTRSVPTNAHAHAMVIACARTRRGWRYQVVHEVGRGPRRLGRKEGHVHEHEAEEDQDRAVAEPPRRVLNPRRVRVRYTVRQRHSNAQPQLQVPQSSSSQRWQRRSAAAAAVVSGKGVRARVRRRVRRKRRRGVGQTISRP